LLQNDSISNEKETLDHNIKEESKHDFNRTILSVSCSVVCNIPRIGVVWVCTKINQKLFYSLVFDRAVAG